MRLAERCRTISTPFLSAPRVQASNHRLLERPLPGNPRLGGQRLLGAGCRRILVPSLESAQKHLGVMAASMTPLSLSATDGIASPAPPQVSTRFSYLCCLCTATRAVPKPGRLRSRVTAVARLGNRFAVPGYGE